MTGFSAIPLDDDGPGIPDTSRWAGISRIRGPPWTHLPSITIGLLGVQIFWAVEMSYASPYLVSLGLSKSMMALVFMAGPLSGLIMQPLIGVLADNSKSRFGRRRPYMLGGTIICMLAMLLLGYTRPVASIFTLWDSRSNDVLTIWLAVIALYCVDFSINAVQAVDRALLVDTLPTSDQASGNAWAARMLGFGSVVGFFVGTINLPRIFPWLGSTQLEVFAAVSSFLLIFMHGVTAFLVEEKVLISSGMKKKSFLQEIREIFTNILTLPRVIRQICIIQFFAWIGWFPVIFYSTMYIGDIYKRSVPAPADDEAELALDAEATRLGSRALLYSSLLSLATNIILPFFVAEARTRPGKDTPIVLTPVGAQGWFARVQVHLATMWAASHVIFAGCMAATLFTSSVFGSTVLVSITGFSWAITQWAPFSLLAEAILTERAAPADEPGSIRLTDTRSYPARLDDEQQFLVVDGDNDDNDDAGSRASSLDDSTLRPAPGATGVMGNRGAQLSRLDIAADGAVYAEDSAAAGGLSAKAGIILGIHNVFIVVPQFLVTGLASVIFAIFDPAKSVIHHPAAPKLPLNGTAAVVVEAVANTTLPLVEMLREEAGAEAAKTGPNAVGIVFRVGGVSATIAFILCWRLAREIRHR